MDAEEYRELIAQFLKGTLEQAKPSSWGGKAVLACLDRFRNEDWPGFGEAILLLAVPEFDALQGDLHYLRGNARYAQAEYAEAIGFYEEALKLRTESCQLFTPGLIRYNQFVARSFDPAFSFKEELPRLRETRREAELSDDAYLQGLVLNSYGNHYYFSGQFRRAFRLYRSAFRRFENQSRLLNTLNAIGNTIRAGIQIGAFHESERLIQKLTTRLQETGHSFMKERFDRVFAEYLAARERFEESLIHLDFTQSALAPYESAWMGLLKAQVLLALDQPGAPELLE